MAASGSVAVLGEAHLDDMFPSPVNGLCFSRSSIVSVSSRRLKLGTLKASVSKVSEGNYDGNCGKDLLSSHSYGGGLVNGYFGLKRPRFLDPLVNSSRRVACVSSSARDVGNPHEEQQLLGVNLVSGQRLQLLSGACYLPHPEKESYGGEDAHFICFDEQVIGVADGVGGWADVGINAGLYARELMANSVRAIREAKGDVVDPLRVLEEAHSGTKAQGSSTACIIALTNQGIHALNLGDSGFIVIRDGCTIFQSPVQQHGFNFTYQLERGTSGDLPSSGQVFKIPTAPGDLIVAGTDGLFDNLYNKEVTAVTVEAVKAGLDPQETAHKIATLARERALDRTIYSPFAAAAEDAGYRYYGGKLDDITVIVSYVAVSTT